MALFEKAEKVSNMEYAKAIVKAELLGEENERLRAQVDRLQEALVAATSPKAYDVMQRDKLDGIEVQPSKAQLDAEADRKAEADFNKDYIDNLEKPIFSDADDMIAALSKLVGVSIADQPVHANNQES